MNNPQAASDGLNLAPYAVSEATSRRRVHTEPPPVHRTAFQRDRDRVIHSAAFRRLEYKTQVFVNHEGDLFRTRLTHSLEVAQIARTIARALRLNEDLTEAIALAHDLGHTPFGHAGQDALNRCMREFGGFEHNLQSLRVVDELEMRYADFPGLNLSFVTREGILKHCAIHNAQALGEIGRRFTDKTQPSLEAQVVNLADEIAYNNHDVDDGLRAGLLELHHLREVGLFNTYYTQVSQRYPMLDERRRTYEVIRRMINHLAVDLIETTQAALDRLQPACPDDIRRQAKPVADLSADTCQANRELKQFLSRVLYRHYRVYRMSAKAQRIIAALFEVFMNDFKLLPSAYQGHARRAGQASGEAASARVIADYIAGMTDRYAVREYERIFEVHTLS